MPERKRESERQAFEELRGTYAPSDVADCLARLLERGLPDGQVCHSPMAFLAKAMDQVLAEVKVERDRDRMRAEAEAAKAALAAQEQERQCREDEEFTFRELAFNRAFPGEDRQREVIAEYCRGMPFRSEGIAGRTFAVGRWWATLNGYEREEALDGVGAVSAV